MIKLCVFDMDGLLLDTERQMYAKFGEEASAEMGRPMSLDFLTTVMGGSKELYRDRVLSVYGEDYPYEEYQRRRWEKINRFIDRGDIPLRPGVPEFLEFCSRQGILKALATSTRGEVAQKCLKASGIAAYFDYMVSGDMVEKTKPNPEIFLKPIEHFNIPLNETLVFEDSHNGAQAAINGKLRYILVKDLAFLTEEDMENAEMVTDVISKAIPLIEKENERTAGI
ncbi:MAG: HAD family phosphatase [Erysipelotrichaceae bacterium]|nr:HAD family phosphatase [Erysipelotrichaceae bacterium]